MTFFRTPTGDRIPTGDRSSVGGGRSSARRAGVRLVAMLSVALTLAAACTGDDDPADDAAVDDANPESAEQEEVSEEGLRFEGPDEGAVLNADELETLSFTVEAVGGASLEDLRLLLDGDDVTTDAETRDATLHYEPDELDDGQRVLAVVEVADTEGDGATSEAVSDDGVDTGADADATTDPGETGATAGDEHHAWRFEVDTEPPTVELTAPDGAITDDEDTVTVAGETEPGATVDVGTETATVDDTGTFELEVAVDDGADELTLRITDVAGNTTEVVEPLAFVASRVEVDEIRTVHATFWAWATPSLREPIVQMIDDGRINALQLDLKDEGGQLGYASEVELAQEIGADVGPLDLEETVAELHDRDIAVVGRIVAFADPTLASWAWDNGERDWVIQVPDGSDYYRGSYAGFSNYTHEDVITYLLDIAEEAARAGVDHILWDYIRRPEGLDNYVVPGLETTPEEAIVDFTRQADERLAPYGVQHGASVYGIAADRPTQIGQDIPEMAEHLDYVAPMIYPSHWGPGEYGVADPNRQPYDIIRATLEVWDETVEGKRARVVPWLEDTPYRAWDRPHQVREQIRAAREHGIDEWLMWNPGSTFTPSAYEQRE